MSKYRIKIELTEKEEAEVYYQRKCGKNKMTRLYANILYNANKGTESLKELYELADCDYQTTKRILNGYKEKGIAIIYQCARGKRRNHLDEKAEEIMKVLDENPPSSVPAVTAMLKEKFGIEITETPVRYWLKKGYRYRKTRAVPAKANLKLQLHFLENVLMPLLDMAVNRLVKVFFCDGVHLTYGYSGSSCWCKKRVSIPSAYGRKRVNCLGFMDAVTYQTETIMNASYLNADSVCEGLKILRDKNPDEYICVILDNAAYQRCKKVKNAAAQYNINLVFLPSYSPNLNLIERLWKFLRKKVLSNKYYSSFSDFFNIVRTFLASVHISFSDELHSLLSYHFECFDSSLLIGFWNR